jgi:hypothetical protein
MFQDRYKSKLVRSLFLKHLTIDNVPHADAWLVNFVLPFQLYPSCQKLLTFMSLRRDL